MPPGRWRSLLVEVGDTVSAGDILGWIDDADARQVVASAELATTVYPFILRGISLLGIDSQNCPMPTRKMIWQKLSREWKLEDLEGLASQCSLEELEPEIQRILKGRMRGRTVVRVSR